MSSSVYFVFSSVPFNLPNSDNYRKTGNTAVRSHKRGIPGFCKVIWAQVFLYLYSKTQRVVSLLTRDRAVFRLRDDPSLPT